MVAGGGAANSGFPTRIPNQNPPVLTDRSTVTVEVQKVVGAQASAVTDSLAAEEPLEIQLGYEKKGWHVHKSISVTMRTPGHDFELAAGFLFTEGILRRPDQIAQIRSEPAD